MALRDKFDIELDTLPVQFETSFGEEAFQVQINYNELGDFFTIDIWDATGNPIVYGEKLVYGRRIWRSYANTELPAVDLVPLDESGQTTVCNKETFGQTVFLYIDSVIDDNAALASDDDDDSDDDEDWDGDDDED